MVSADHAPPTLAALRAAAERSLAAGDAANTERLCAAWLARQPDDAEALRLAALAALAQGRAGDALSRLQHALRLAPHRADLHAQRARVLSLIGRIPEALAAVEAALAVVPTPAALDPESLDTLGVVLSRGHRHEQACTLFEIAVCKAPGRASLQFNLASSLKFAGRFDAAEAAYEACIGSDPRFWKAHSGLAQLRTATAARNHLPRLTALSSQPAAEPQAVIHLRQALAKECEDLGRSSEALQHLILAKAARRQLQPYDPRGDAACFDAVESLFATPLPPAPGCPSREPIFVVGMPRTGTTLIDRILSSHPQVSSAGELQNAAYLLKRAAGTPGRSTLDVETLRASLAADPKTLGEAYVASTRPGTGQRAHFVDKMPLNIWYAGHLQRALPEARIVCLLRHPLDTVLSNFRQLFSIDNPTYNYADDLLDCTRYVLGFRRLVALWQRRLGPAFMVLDYETLIAAPEATIRALLVHCRLPWDPRCLAFENNPSPVATASSVQVRQPLNTAAVGRWRAHADALAPARQLFEASGIACD